MYAYSHIKEFQKLKELKLLNSFLKKRKIARKFDSVSNEVILRNVNNVPGDKANT